MGLLRQESSGSRHLESALRRRRGAEGRPGCQFRYNTQSQTVACIMLWALERAAGLRTTALHPGRASTCSSMTTLTRTELALSPYESWLLYVQAVTLIRI